MRHGHQPGWAPEEIGLFVDSYCRDGKPLPRVVSVESSPQAGVRGKYFSFTKITKAQLHYTTDTGPQSKREWQSRALLVDSKSHSLEGAAVPTEATTWFITLTDERGAMISSAPEFAKN